MVCPSDIGNCTALRAYLPACLTPVLLHHAAAVRIQHCGDEVQAAKAQLHAADASVTDLRGQLAALNSDFKGQLAAKDVQLSEMHASMARLTEQMVDAEAAQKQAEGHAGTWQRAQGAEELQSN